MSKIINTDSDRTYSPQEERHKDNAIVGMINDIRTSLQSISDELKNLNDTLSFKNDVELK